MSKYLIFDMSNVLYRTFFVHPHEDDDTLAGLAMHSALMSLNKYFKQHKPDKVVMAFDSSSWRKDYTASSICISKKPYKGNRRKDMSPSQQQKYTRFIDHLREFEALMSDYTTVICLRGDKLEADDLIAGFIQAHPDDQLILISSDSDMLQLLIHDNLQIISPQTDKAQSLEDYNNDARYYLFTKCIRGDATDNVQSALPRVRTKRIQQAYNDPFERVQLMKETWKDHEGNEYRVEELYEENQLLIDLTQQPDPIRIKMADVIKEATSKKQKYSHFHVLKFVGKYDLEKIKASIDQFIPMLSRP